MRRPVRLPGRIQPLVVAIDVEPDPRRPDPGIKAPWLGFEGLLPVLESWRGRLAAATGRPVHYTWFAAVSPQTAAIYGDAAWPLLRYRAEFERCLAAGDALGLHVHFWRLTPGVAGGWVIEHEDRHWMEAALRDSFAAYERVLKRPCRLFRFGDGWLAGWALDLVARLGAEIDLTLEPGWPARPGLVEDEPHRGGLPDRRGAPLAPYRRQGLNFRHRAWIGGRTPWLLPITTGALGAGGGVPAGQFSQLLWGMPPAALAPLLETAFSNGRRPVVVSVMRSEVSLGLVDRLEAGFAELARRPDIARHPVMTPAEALDAIGKRLSPARGAASPWAGSRPVSDIMEAV